jgi:hypothetical protein
VVQAVPLEEDFARLDVHLLDDPVEDVPVDRSGAPPATPVALP